MSSTAKLADLLASLHIYLFISCGRFRYVFRIVLGLAERAESRLVTVVVAAVAGSTLTYVTGTVARWLDSPESPTAIASSASALSIMPQAITISIHPYYLLSTVIHQHLSLPTDLPYR